MQSVVSKSRIPSLYKDFRLLEDVNPEGYSANINAWKIHLLENVFPDMNSILLRTGDGFLHALYMKEYGYPKSIDIVIDALVEEKVLIRLQEFETVNSEDTDGTVSKIFKWVRRASLQKMTRFHSRCNDSDSNYLREDTFVIMPLLEDKYKTIYEVIKHNILAKATTICDLVLPKNEFYERSGMLTVLSVNDHAQHRVFLDYLQFHAKIILRNENLVKIIDPLVESIYKQFGTNISENDERVAEIKACSSHIEMAIEKYEVEVNEYRYKIFNEDFFKLPKKTQLEYKKACLFAQRVLYRLLTFRNNLREIQYQLDMSVSNLILFGALKSSKSVIHTINDQIGPLDQVQDLLEELREENVNADEMSKMLSSEIARFDDDELEEELRELQYSPLGSDDSIKVSEISSSTEDENKMLEQLNKLKITDNEKPRVFKNQEHINNGIKVEEKSIVQEEV
ncbi:Uncharacterized protein RNJ44_04648 [Nakaseomyces bracarensis]|uniref:Uncharacterized protein n=1 Tax=Nakaseomyces bracarensis TaxID=273131 RepID=A0ABR4NVH9_9SACH